jgi:hypothetical protein
MSSTPPATVTPSPDPFHSEERFGFKVLTFGGTGNGKTHSLQTLRKAGIKCLVIFTENGMSTLRGTDPEWVDWMYIPASKPNLQAGISMAKKINQLDRKQLAQYQDPYRSLHQQYIKVLEAMSNFKGERTGKVYGPIEKLDQTCCVVLDSLSGSSIMAMELVVGDVPMIDPGEWGIGMGRIEKMIQLLCLGVPCHVIVNAHEEREPDEITQSTKIMVSAPGKKLAPKIPRFFDDVLYAYRKSTQWLWSTDYPNVADLKSRHLGIFAAAPQDYGPIVEAWKKDAGTGSAK